MQYRKKMIEVALPLEAINKAAAREKSIRHGHPSTLHLWWARRPLAACRAVLFASLVDDPDSDPAYRQADGTVDEDRAGVKRAELFDLIEELVQWENSNNPSVINRARAEIARCVASRKIELAELKKETVISGRDNGKPHPSGPISRQGITAWEVVLMQAGPQVVNAFLAEHAPPVLDPFCGGGSIPLEAQRLGLRAYASDLNPVAVLITKALVEIPPKFAEQPPVNPKDRNAQMEWPGTSGLAADVRYYGRWIRDEAEKRIAHLYPKVKVTAKMAKDRKDLEPYAGQELTVLAWLWARTVTCPNPACRTKLPLLKAYSLCTKPSRTRRLVPRVNQERGSITFDVEAGKTDGREGTISRSGATCLACSTHIPYAYIREAGRAGQMSEQLLAVVCDGPRGRLYFSPDRLQEDAAATARPKWCPQIDIPHNPFSLRPPLYGFAQFSDLFTNRQLVAMEAFSSLIQRLKAALPASIDPAYRDALLTYSAMNVSRLANRCSSACFWDPGGENIQQVFARQAIAMAWDFVEANPLGSASGSFLNQIDYLAAVIEQSPPCSSTGQVLQRDACDLGQWGKGILVSTDPPYYDNIDYADLSDFFYVWLRRMLEGVYPENFGTMLTPKTRELVATPYRFNGDREAAEAHFREGLANVLTAICRQNVDGIPASIIYAFKQQEEDDSDGGRASTGWETFLQSAVDVGFSVTGTWPLRTELAGNLKNQMNALASSIVLACRRRDAKAKVATRKEFLVSLRRELSPAMRNLQHGSIAPVDLAQAAIGPGMAVFTRYAKVMEGDGSPMTVRTALGLINQTLDEVLAEQEGEFDTDTRWALAWFEQHGMDEGPFGVAETLSKAKNTSVTGMVEAGVVAARGGKVKLLGRDDLPADWDPATDERLTVWEVTQYLIRALEQHGERGAAELLKKVGGMGEVARDLAYRLYVICERKKWAQEALAYNSLVVAWPEITKLAQGAPPAMPRKEQGELGL